MTGSQSSKNDTPIAARLIEFGSDLLYSPILNNFWGRLFLIAGIVLPCATRAYIGLIGCKLFAHDAFMFFDGAWRMINGQRPHIDFYSNLGVLTYVPTVLGLWISRGSAWGFGYGQAAVGLAIGLWIYLLGRRRFSDAPLVLMCIALTSFTVAPSAPGWLILKIGPATTYNRLGYVLITLLLIESLLKRRDASLRSAFQGGVSSGCVIGVLLFLKITYFVVGILLLFATIPCSKQRKVRWVGLASGFLLIIVPILSYMGFSVSPILQDLKTVAGAKRVHLESYMLDGILEQAGLVMVFSLAAVLLLLRHERRDRAKVLLIAGSLVSLSGLLLILGNTEEAGFPLGGLWATIVLNEITASIPMRTTKQDFFRVSVLLFGLTLSSGTLLSGALSIVAGIAGRIHYPQRLLPMDSPVLSGFLIAGNERWYTDFVNDGFRLVRQLREPQDTIMCLDFANPFSYSLGIKPAPGGTTVLNYQTTFSDFYRPSAASLFGSAKLVIVPKVFSDGSLYSINRLYGSYLDSHFYLIGESVSWRLYRQRSLLTSGSRSLLKAKP